MTSRRVVLAFGAGVVLAFVLLGLMAFGSAILAVSGERTVHIPLLLTARSGSGEDLLDMNLNGPGSALWFVGLSLLIGLPMGLMRRRREPDRAL